MIWLLLASTSPEGLAFLLKLRLGLTCYVHPHLGGLHMAPSLQAVACLEVTFSWRSQLPCLKYQHIAICYPQFQAQLYLFFLAVPILLIKS